MKFRCSLMSIKKSSSMTRLLGDFTYVCDFSLTKAETFTYSGQRILSVKLYKIFFFFFFIIRLNFELLHKWLKEKLNHLSLISWAL